MTDEKKNSVKEDKKSISKLIKYLSWLVVIILAIFLISQMNLFDSDTVKCDVKKDQEYVECINNLALEKNNADICDELEDDMKSDFCKFQVYEKNKNIKKCDNLKTENWKDNCYYNIGMEINDIDSCSKIKINRMMTECVMDVAVDTKNPKGCEMIDNKDKCYYQVALESENYQTCELIQDRLTQSICYKKTAFAKLNTSICSNIEFLDIKIGCFDNIEKELNQTNN